MEDTENKKEGIAKAALADQKRKDKLLTRAAKGAWDWTKDKASGIAKSTMGFMATVGKLMLLVAAYFLLQWLKGKDLKKWWDRVMEFKAKSTGVNINYNLLNPKASGQATGQTDDGIKSVIVSPSK